jgi:mRNA interferase MazF
VPVDIANGLAGPSVVSCDNITTIPTNAVGAQIGVLLDHQERALSQAIQAAFDLD